LAEAWRRPNRRPIRLECFRSRALIVARDSKPEDSDSFRLTGYRRSHYSLQFATKNELAAVRRRRFVPVDSSCHLLKSRGVISDSFGFSLARCRWSFAGRISAFPFSTRRNIKKGPEQGRHGIGLTDQSEACIPVLTESRAVASGKHDTYMRIFLRYEIG
jgi:hypothetical protein